jgi:hypothetical protein
MITTQQERSVKHFPKIPVLFCAKSFLLGAFAKLRKATTSFVMSVLPSVCLFVSTEELGFHWTDFHEILYMSIFRKSVENNSTFIKI